MDGRFNGVSILKKIELLLLFKLKRNDYLVLGYMISHRTIGLLLKLTKILLKLYRILDKI